MLRKPAASPSTHQADATFAAPAVYAAVSGSTPTTHGQASFDDWFAPHAGRQALFSMPVGFDQSDGAYSLALPSFWPIDGE